MIDNLNVYPNPNEGVFIIAYKSKKEKNIEIKIVNVLGKKVLHKTHENFSGEFLQTYNLEKQGPGIYLLQIKIDEIKYLRKIVVQ